MSEAQSKQAAIDRAFFHWWDSIASAIKPHLKHSAAFVAGFEAGSEYQKGISTDDRTPQRNESD